MNCPICRSPQLSTLYCINTYDIVACGRCGGWSVPAVLRTELEETSASYSADYLKRGEGQGAQLSGYYDYEAERGLHLKNFQQNLEILAQHVTGPRLLDVGCATGHFLEAAAQAGYQVMGTDISETAVQHVREKLHFPAVAGDILRLNLEERFDVITLWETVEHLTRPAAVLHKLRSWLRPGGVLVIGTGDNTSLLARWMGARWWYLTPPDHVLYYNPRALGLLLNECELEVDAWHRIRFHWVSSRNVVMKLLRSFRLPPAQVLTWSKRMPLLPLPILHNTTMVAVARHQKVRLR